MAKRKINSNGVAMIPYSALQRQVEAGGLTQAQLDQMVIDEIVAPNPHAVDHVTPSAAQAFAQIESLVKQYNVEMDVNDAMHRLHFSLRKLKPKPEPENVDSMEPRVE